MAAAATDDAPNFQLPPLPKLDGDARYTVLIHPSIANSAAADPADILGSRQRIDLLGKTVLDMVVTHILFSRTPLLSQDNLRVRRAYMLSYPATKRQHRAAVSRAGALRRAYRLLARRLRPA
jgi:hypothetical protein